MKLTTSKISLLTRIIVLSFSVLFLFSCESEEITPEVFTADFELPTTLVAGEIFSIDPLIDGNTTKTEWILSDGAVFTTQDLSYSFSQPGTYSITLNNYFNAQLQSSVEKKVKVLSNGTILNTEGKLQVIDAAHVKGNLVLRVLSTISTEEPSKEITYILDENLNVIQKEMVSGDVVSTNSYVTDNKNSLNLLNDFELIGGGSDVINGLALSYNSGYINVNMDAMGKMSVNHYNEADEKLWTKTFTGNTFAGQKYIGKLNNRLFYFSFSQDMDSVYIEKFSNPSVVLSRIKIDISKFPDNSEVLFAFVNPINEQMYLGVYSQKQENSYVFGLSEDCKLSISTIVEGHFKGQLQSVSSDGSMIIKNGNELTNFNSLWEVASTKDIGMSDYGICPLGDNLSVLYKNLPNGSVQLSYVDKHFNTVNF